MKKRIYKQCCACHRTYKQGEWVDDTPPEGAFVTHGYCLACKQGVIDEILEHYGPGGMRKLKKNAFSAAFEGY